MSRKKFYVGVGICMALLIASGCGEEKDNSSDKNDREKSEVTERWGSTVVDELEESVDMTDYVELGEYKGLHLEKGITQISEEQINTEIKRILSNTQVIDGQAQKDDTVVISYTASIDGTPLSDNFSAGEQIVLGESDKIEGFDEGIIGMYPGESKDITLQVPKDYEQNSEIAGKKITYHVILDTITREYKELTEDWIHEYTQYGTVQEYRDSVKTNMEQAVALNEQEAYEQNMWEQLLKNCTIKKYLEDSIVAVEEQYDMNMENKLAISEIELEDYLQENEMTEEEYQQQREETIRTEAAKDMIMRAIAEKEKFSEKDKDYKTILQEMEAENQVTEEELISMYGEGALKKEIMKKRVIDLIMENAEK